MKNYLPLVFLILVGCKEKEPEQNNFTSELQQLQTYFHLPGLAAIVTKGDQIVYENYFGYADLENKVPVDSTTQFQMASLTKMFTGQLILRMPPSVLDSVIYSDSIKVKHVLSHTSQGSLGKNFYYSGRFSRLTNVIGDYERRTNDEIIRPNNLIHTFLLNDSSQVTKELAKPYAFDGENKPGFVDYGFSASAGIVSTVRDLAKFSRLLNNVPEFEGQYNYGLFSQTINGTKILWAYGQYDCYSSLFIKVPKEDLTLVLATNNIMMSDPPRMIYGDVRSSLFALSFLRNFLGADLPNETKKAYAIAESYFSQVDPNRAEDSRKILREVFASSEDYASLTTLHNLIILKDSSFNEFDPQIRQIGSLLRKKDPDNPYNNYYIANFYEINNQQDSAALYYQKIIDAKNFDKTWMRGAAERYFNERTSTSKPGK